MSNRDQRFVAAHRGGPLSAEQHSLMAAWAADCAEHVLPLFENHSSDDRPLKAIVAARAWAAGEISVGAAREAAFTSHAAAREALDKPAIAVARAAGHAAATAHMADHSLSAACYVWKAIDLAQGTTLEEIEWQLRQLPAEICSLIQSGLEQKYPKAFRSGSKIK
ncbi:putative immunity protein [Adhaeretor mobilis]|uniref:Imm-5-like domain-containing protein n=1 Tax=Adhaeretor mobilis TaxID=1930276 RepID=A0A517MQU7_9BACT|nr:hypothetical protein [Adhaeretor mobilis]QDS97255.1 hypothetical protein HG15A2_05160 [Adhaeretor mobilis]